MGQVPPSKICDEEKSNFRGTQVSLAGYRQEGEGGLRPSEEKVQVVTDGTAAEKVGFLSLQCIQSFLFLLHAQFFNSWIAYNHSGICAYIAFFLGRLFQGMVLSKCTFHHTFQIFRFFVALVAGEHTMALLSLSLSRVWDQMTYNQGSNGDTKSWWQGHAQIPKWTQVWADQSDNRLGVMTTTLHIIILILIIIG